MSESENAAGLSPEAEAYLRLLGSVAPPKGAAYAAVPITTGARFLSWYATRGVHVVAGENYAEEHRVAVVEPNCVEAASRIAAIRKALSLPVIDPSAFDRGGWSQEEYRCFWAAVIKRYAAMVVLLDGWQYSSGCSLEFFTAVRNGIATFKENLQPLSRSEGHSLVGLALSEFQAYRLQAPVLESVVRKLDLEDVGQTTRSEGER